MNDEYNKGKDRAKEASTVRRIVWFTVLALVVVIAVIIGTGYFYIQHALKPVTPESNKKVEVHIERGASVSDIAHKLDKKGIVRSAMVFQGYTKYKHAGSFQAGDYEFTPSMDIDQIMDRMHKGEVAAALQLQFPEGIWMTDIAGIIAKNTNYKKKDILKKMKNNKYIKNTYMKEYSFLNKVILGSDIRYPLEGYLFPATYSFAKKNPPLETILKKMLDKTGTILDKYQAQMNKNKQSPHEVMTLASLIEQEGTKKGNRRKISSVFYNRLHKDMPLQTDPTIDYARKKHDAQITLKDLKMGSPYNTYQHKGLPPGPIAIPGENSIAAAVNPDHTDYLYFYAKLDGKIFFSKTYKQHRKVVKKYNKDWKEYIRKEKNKKK